jgi:hypothetical protein
VIGAGASVEKVSVNVKGGRVLRENVEGAETKTVTRGVLGGASRVSKRIESLPPRTSHAILVVDSLGISIAGSELLETADKEFRDSSALGGQCVMEVVGLKRRLYLLLG